MVAAGIASFRGATSRDMGTALADRMFQFNVQTVIDAFLDHALAMGFAPEVMAYMKVRPDRLDDTLSQLAICADANSALGRLAWLELPASAVRLEQLLGSALAQQHSATAALLAWEVERLYREIDDRKPPTSGGRKQARGSSASGAQQASADSTRRADGPRAAMAGALGAALANDLAPGKETLAAPQDEADDALEWAERVLRGHVGNGAHSMLRALIADLPRPRTPWEQVLRTQLARALAQRPGLSWSRPSRSHIANQGRAGTRRMPWEPGPTASRAVPRGCWWWMCRARSTRR